MRLILVIIVLVVRSVIYCEMVFDYVVVFSYLVIWLVINLKGSFWLLILWLRWMMWKLQWVLIGVVVSLFLESCWSVFLNLVIVLFLVSCFRLLFWCVDGQVEYLLEMLVKFVGFLLMSVISNLVLILVVLCVELLVGLVEIRICLVFYSGLDEKCWWLLLQKCWYFFLVVCGVEIFVLMMVWMVVFLVVFMWFLLLWMGLGVRFSILVWFSRSCCMVSVLVVLRSVEFGFLVGWFWVFDMIVCLGIFILLMLILLKSGFVFGGMDVFGFWQLLQLFVGV